MTKNQPSMKAWWCRGWLVGALRGKNRMTIALTVSRAQVNAAFFLSCALRSVMVLAQPFAAKSAQFTHLCRFGASHAGDIKEKTKLFQEYRSAQTSQHGPSSLGRFVVPRAHCLLILVIYHSSRLRQQPPADTFPSSENLPTVLVF